MASGKKGSGKTAAKSERGRVRHDKPISILETVDELPPRGSQASAVQETLDAILENKGSWVKLDPAGRQPNSVQSMVTSAARARKLNIKVAVRGEEIYARAE